MLALPLARGELCQRWRQATKLILDQADVAAVSHQVHLALFYDAQLDIKAMPQLKSHRVFAQTLFAGEMDARVKPAHDKRGTPTWPASSRIAGSRRPRRQGQPGPDQADTRRLGRVLDETQHSNRVREVLGLACARPNLRFKTGGLVSVHCGSGAVSAGRTKRTLGGGFNPAEGPQSEQRTLGGPLALKAFFNRRSGNQKS